MKYIKFILITFIILLVTIGIPYVLHHKYVYSNYVTQIKGDAQNGLMDHLLLITKDKDATQNIITNTMKLFDEFSNTYNGHTKDLINLFFATSILFGITLLILGIVLLKLTSKKILSISVITSSIMSIIFYLAIYFYNI